MRHHTIIRIALAACLAAATLTIPTTPEPASTTHDAPPAEVPALTLLAGPAPSTVTIDPADLPAPASAVTALLIALCDGHLATLDPEPACAHHDRWTPAVTATTVRPTPLGGSGDPTTGPLQTPHTALRVLYQLRARSTLPDGHGTHLDPRPA